MNLPINVNQNELFDLLLNVSVVRPIFIWGPPGIGKSSIVQKFAETVGIECVSLLGSQLAPEDIIGVPQIVDGVSRFCPPKLIAKSQPFCLFLDELNACSQEVQKAFYSLIQDKRIGEYELPKGSIVIGAGNRSQDSAIVKQMSSALINRMLHVELIVSVDQWINWAMESGINQTIIEYLKIRPDQLWSQPSKSEEPFSTPRSWHMLSDALNEFKEDVPENVVDVLIFGCLTQAHGTQFRAFYKQLKNKYQLNLLIEGEARWPNKPEDRDLLYFLALSFRAQLIKSLPFEKNKMSTKVQNFVQRSKVMLKDLASISLEIAQMVVSSEENKNLPTWYMIEIIRDLPNLVDRKDLNEKKAQ